MILFDQFPLKDIKLVVEIAAFALGAIFILLRLLDGQGNSTMEVSLELERTEGESPGLDFLAIKLGLKRADIGRLKLQDIVIEISDVSDESLPKVEIRDHTLHEALEQASRGRTVAGWVYLPPKEATQLGYFARVKRQAPVLVEVRIVATRTGFGHWHRPEWRASAVSLPGKSDT